MNIQRYLSAATSERGEILAFIEDIEPEAFRRNSCIELAWLLQ
jgi:hypothetical protein